MGDRLRLGDTVVLLTCNDLLAESIAERERLAVVGRLAADVVHDLNGLLTVFLSCAELAREVCSADQVTGADLAEVRESLDDILAAARTGSELTKRVLVSARSRSVTQGELDLSMVAGSAASLLARALPPSVRLEQELVPGVWIRGDEVELHQIIMNLLVNARDAVGGKGCLRVGARRDPSGRLALLIVSDDGAGMDEATRQRIFEPFFTTKAAGTGLGLPTVARLVAAHGGTIRAVTAPGLGCTFTVSLPLSRRAEPQSQGSRTTRRGHGPGARACVFVVDRSPAARGAVRRGLTRSGYHVLEAPDVAALLDAVRGDESLRPDAILVDCPNEMYDDVVLSQLRDARGVGPVVGMHTGPMRTEVLAAAGVQVSVAKPFTLDSLLAAIDGLLGPIRP
jgi:CheY-like chemotaxis protein